MDYVRMGTTGLKVSRICVGCMSFGASADWMINEEASRSFIQRSLEAGLNFFDTANVYSRGESEEILGRALKDFGPSRDRVVIATKVFHPMGDDPNERGLSRKHIRHAIDNSLRRLQTDYVDLYQIHRFDPTTPIEETLEALTELVKEGKVLYIGASSMRAYQFAKFLHAADRLGTARFVTMQNNYSLLYREEEREMNPLCRSEGVGLIPYSRLAAGCWSAAGGGDGALYRLHEPRPLQAAGGREGHPDPGGACREARRAPGAVGARLAADEAGDDRTDRRPHQAASSGRRAEIA